MRQYGVDCLNLYERLMAYFMWEWSKIQEDGADLENAYGPGMTGLINIGSSCYMNSVLQSFLLVPDFCNRFGGANALRTMHALPPADMYMDFNGQLARLVHAMLEGEYSLPDNPHNGIKPTQFKRIAGAGHPEFKTARQQDAEEYVRYLIEKITAKTPAGVSDPMLAFKFHKEERLQDLNTRKVRYTQNEETVLAIPVLKSSLHAIPDQEGRFSACFKECLANVFEPEQIEDRYLKSVTFKSFPDFLIVQLQKFTVDEATYQQKKLDIDLAVPDVLDLSQYRSLGGLQPGETPMEENEPIVVAAPKLDVDENIVAQLEGMGFSRNAALKAALDTKTQGLEAAAEWLMLRLDDPSINDPPVNPAGPVNVNPGSSVDNESVSMLEGFGFTKHQARFALHKFNFDANMAAEWLFMHIDEVPPEPAAEEKPVAHQETSTGVNQMRDGNGKYHLVGFISHMGSSPHSGHYVAHLLRGNRWVLYNDEKVAYSQNPPKQLAYLYLYRRQ
ncbi:unnamed protein product, partial [Mesorhabditis belari]|uniref:Ubiquitin carboxyl-terminal hydrolase n=1 Tax=Mesorhabditis belari TaxID=2138241 RepID=A0AAF3J5W1_9BILA